MPNDETPTTPPPNPMPTIGRVVIYHHPHGDEVLDLAALVVNVANIDRPSFGAPGILVVNLCVFDPHGSIFSALMVKQGDDQGQWSWPQRV